MACVFIPIFVTAGTTLALSIFLLARRESRRKIASVPCAWLLPFWAVFAIAAGLRSGNFLGNMAYVVFLAFIAVSFYMFRSMTPELGRRILQLTAVLSMAAFLVAALQVLLFPTVRATSVFYNANYYGFVCEILILADLYGFFFDSSRLFRPLYLLAAALNMGGILLSGCRSAWPALLAGGVVLFLCLKRYRLLGILLAAGAVCTGVLVRFPHLIPRIDSFNTTEPLRFKIWSIAWHSFLSHPVFGQGFVTYKLISAGMGRADLYHAHNILLNALINYGALGVLLLLGFVIPNLIQCIRKLRVRRSCSLALAVFTAILIHGITDDPVIGFQTGILAMTLLSLCCIKAPGETVQAQPPG